MPAHPPISRNDRLRWALLLILALAFALRFLDLKGKSLWGDELDTVRILMLTPKLGDMVERLHRYDRSTYVNPPLFFVLVKLILVRLDVLSETNLRLIPAIAGMLCVPAFLGLARHFLTRGHALAATLLFAVSPVSVYYSQECRPYSLFLLEAILMQWMLIGWLRRGGGWRLAGLSLATMLALYTSYVTLMLSGCLGAATLAWLAARRPSPMSGPHARRRLTGLGVSVIGACLTFYPWLGPTLRFLRLNRAPVENKFHPWSAWILHAELLGWPLWMAFATWLPLAILVGSAWRGRRRLRAGVAFLTTMIFLPIVILSVFKPYHYHPRHVIFLQPALTIAIYMATCECARLLARSSHSPLRRRVVAGFVAGWLAINVSGLVVYYAIEKENWRDAIAWVEPRFVPGDAVIPGIYFTQDALIVYHGAGNPDVAFYPDFLDPETFPIILGKHDRVWFITSFLTALPDWLKIRLGNEFALMQEFPGTQTIYIYLYEKPRGGGATAPARPSGPLPAARASR
jgi:4-amino-4-deoxy-L-arabinose transferase-like glycosyltransferase